jgi:2-phosphosulfolactate phosphatase
MTRVDVDWGARAVDVFEAWADVVVVVDVLSFSTAVDVAVSRGATVVPCADQAAADRLGEDLDALVAVRRKEMSAARPYSLSPASLAALPAGAMLVLPSPNGSALTAALAAVGQHVVAGCLRNRAAVGAYLSRVGSKVGVVAAGERWPSDGSLRPAFEDIVGAGAVIAALGTCRLSPDAAAAAAAFADAAGDLAARLADCPSGRELRGMGFGTDLSWAAELDASRSVPLLINGHYTDVGTR